MVEVGREFEFGLQFTVERGKGAVVNLFYAFAVAADEMMMGGVMLEFVFDVPVPQINDAHESELRQQVEIAIDRRLVEKGIALADAREDLFGGNVSRIVGNDGKDAFALGRKAMPGITNRLDEVGMMSHSFPLTLENTGRVQNCMCAIAVVC